MKITLIAGARPNFVKIAPIIHAINEANRLGAKIEFRLVHTGQHFDEKMSESFFRDLNIPKPDINLECGGGSQAEQTAGIMCAFEKELENYRSDYVLVVGDVTSTMACSIVAKKLGVKVIHVEAGIRSYDLGMPEEINRIVTDSITDIFFTTSKWAGENLRKSGISDDKIHFVGNVMIDTLNANMHRFRKPSFFEELNLASHKYLVLTLHRPSNVDEIDKLKGLIETVIENSQDDKIIFPMHPRTAKMFVQMQLDEKKLKIVDPLSYLEFNYLVKNARGVVTDSGGITEETTVMNVPCLTLRETTERPETIDVGTNELVGTDLKEIQKYLDKLYRSDWKKGNIPELWDGNSAQRIVDVLLGIYG